MSSSPGEHWRCLFAPTTVAVAGASNVVGTWGYNITQRLVQSGRTVYPVNPSHPEILGIPAFKRVTDIPGPIDLAVIAVPAQLVAGVMRDCVAKQIKAGVVVSGGFSEVDDEGKKAEEEVAAIARAGGLRFIGPNTMGHADMTTGVSMLGFMDKINPGTVAFASQSGNMGTRTMQQGMLAGVGFSRFVCTGNEASLRLEDYLEFFGQDDKSTVIALYIEGLREARRFFRLAKEISLKKPIVALKSGGTSGSSHAARSHTGALTGSAAVYAAAFRQTGVISVETDEELADVLAFLLRQPLPRGPRIAVLTMGGGFGVTAAEACEREGLEMATLSQATIDRLSALLPSRWPHGNPVDFAGLDMAGEPLVVSSLTALVEDEGVDAVLSLVSPRGLGPRGIITDPAEAKAAAQVSSDRLTKLNELAQGLGKPIIAVGFTPAQSALQPGTYVFRWEGVPTFASAHRAARALRRVLWYRRFLDSRRAG